MKLLSGGASSCVSEPCWAFGTYSRLIISWGADVRCRPTPLPRPSPEQSPGSQLDAVKPFHTLTWHVLISGYFSWIVFLSNLISTWWLLFAHLPIQWGIQNATCFWKLLIVGKPIRPWVSSQCPFSLNDCDCREELEKLVVPALGDFLELLGVSEITG